MTRRITFFGLFGGPNLGNNATLDAMVSHIRGRIPDVKISCVAPHASSVTQMYSMDLIAMDPLPISRYLWRISNEKLRGLTWDILQVLTEPIRAARARHALAGSDLLLVVGTGVIDEYGQTSLDLPLDLYRWTTAACKAGIPVYFVCVGAEQIKAPLAQRFFRKSLLCARMVTVRDEFSRSQLLALGVNVSEDNIYPDIAYSLSNLPSARSLNAAHQPQTIALGVMGYFGWNREREIGENIYLAYLEKMAIIAADLLDRGHFVRLVTGDTRADQRPVDDLLEKLKAHSKVDHLSWTKISTFGDLLSQLADADIVIAARFHNVLLGLLTGRKVISISYSKKNDAVMSAAGMGQYCYPIETFEPQVVLSGVEELIHLSARTYSARIEAQNIALRKSLDDLFNHILNA